MKIKMGDHEPKNKKNSQITEKVCRRTSMEMPDAGIAGCSWSQWLFPIVLDEKANRSK